MSEEGRALGAALARFLAGEPRPEPEVDRQALARAVQRVKQSRDLGTSGSTLARIPSELPRDLARAIENYRRTTAGFLQGAHHAQSKPDTTAATEALRGADDWMLPPGGDGQPLLRDESAEDETSERAMRERPREPSWTQPFLDYLERSGSELAQIPSDVARMASDYGETLAGFLPGSGLVQAGRDGQAAGEAFRQGNYGQAAGYTALGTLNGLLDVIPLTAALPSISVGRRSGKRPASQGERKLPAFATHEAIPGADTGHLAGFVRADDATRAAYSRHARSWWNNAPGRRDAIYAGMGDTKVLPSIENQGFYQTPGGVLETNPGMTARPLVGPRTVSPADQTMLNAGEATRGYVDAQNASAWHKPLIERPPTESGSVFVPMPQRPATLEEMLELRKLGAPHGLHDVVDTGQGVTMTSFHPPPSGAALDKGIHATLFDEIKQAVPEAGQARRAALDSGYIDYVDAWRQGEGSGAATRVLLQRVNASPEIRSALNNNPRIPQNALARMERDEEWARMMGATRKDIQAARKIIGQGPGWVDRLEEALKQGAILPALALPLLASGMGEGAGGDSR